MQTELNEYQSPESVFPDICFDLLERLEQTADALDELDEDLAA